MFIKLYAFGRFSKYTLFKKKNILCVFSNIWCNICSVVPRDFKETLKNKLSLVLVISFALIL